MCFVLFLYCEGDYRHQHVQTQSFPTRRSSVLSFPRFRRLGPVLGRYSTMKPHLMRLSLLFAGGAGVALAGCGQADFARMVEAECAQDGDPGKDCSCIASQLDDGLPDRVKVAFPALRWPMKPAPPDREAVNNQLLRAADRKSTRLNSRH